MGNCCGSKTKSYDSEASSTNLSHSTSHSIRATSNSAGQSWFSAGISDTPLSPGEILPAANLKIYSFADLKSATRNFKSDTALGGFGIVFKVWVDKKTLAPTKVGTGMVVAIEKLNSESMQGYEEWQLSPFFDIMGKRDDNLIFTRTKNQELVKLAISAWKMLLKLT